MDRKVPLPMLGEPGCELNGRLRRLVSGIKTNERPQFGVANGTGVRAWSEDSNGEIT